MRKVDPKKIIDTEQGPDGTYVVPSRQNPELNKKPDPKTEKQSYVPETFTQENRNFFNRMSEGGQKIIQTMYAGINNVPNASHVIWKLAIAYNSFWLDRHGKKAEKIQDELGRLRKDYTKGEQALEFLIKSRKESVPPKDTKAAEEKLRIFRQNLEDKEDALSETLNTTQEKMRRYAMRRNEITSLFMNKYQEKLGPLTIEKQKVLADQAHMETIAQETAILLREEQKKLEEHEAKLTHLQSIFEEQEKHLDHKTFKTIRKLFLREQKILLQEIKRLRQEFAATQELAEKKIATLMRQQKNFEQQANKLERRINLYYKRIADLKTISEQLPSSLTEQSNTMIREHQQALETQAQAQAEPKQKSTHKRFIFADLMRKWAEKDPEVAELLRIYQTGRQTRYKQLEKLPVSMQEFVGIMTSFARAIQRDLNNNTMQAFMEQARTVTANLSKKIPNAKPKK